MYEPIVIPTDGSEHAHRAAAHALGLAEATDAAVEVVSVLDVRGAAGPVDAGGLDQEFLDRLHAKRERALQAVESMAADRGLDAVRTTVVRGRPADAILTFVSDHDAGLLAMGTHGRSGVSRFVLGSVTEEVMSRSAVPVLTARATDASTPGDYEEVLVPTDGSGYAAAAVDHGIELASLFGARVHALTISNVDTLAGSAAAMPSHVLEDVNSAGEAATEEIATAAGRADLDAVTAVREGSPASGILDYVEANDVDLIAMGTAGRTGPSRFLLGSTTERVVRHADVPVLAVPAPDED
jgi:nucleotide-binding universal stress UspA family protein